MTRGLGLALLAGLPLAAPGGERPPAPLVREVRLLMGTTAEVAAPAGTPGQVLDAAFAELEDVDARMSLWKDSELARLNAAGAAAVSPALLSVIRHALEVSRASGGAFDPTVAPLVAAAGGHGGRVRRVGARERRRLLGRIGPQHVRLEAGGVVRLERGTRLDLGGIAKGYAVDLALARLREAGIDRAVVDLGGSSVGVLGTATFLVRNPFAPGSSPVARFVTGSSFLGTSGSDQRGAHVIDPRTGQAVADAGAATVVAGSAMEADALSTAVRVLGPAQGLALLAARGAEGFVVSGTKGAVVVTTTPGFAARYALVSAAGVTLLEWPFYPRAASAAS